MTAYIEKETDRLMVPVDPLGLVILWNGSATFNIHEASVENGRFVLGKEVGVFTRYAAGGEGLMPDDAVSAMEEVAQDEDLIRSYCL